MIIFIFTVIVCLFISLAIFRFTKRKNSCIQQEHFLITGGSSGIGLAFAIEVVKRGASVTILARNKEKLNEAKVTIANHSKSSKQKIFAIEADVTHGREILENVVREAEVQSGPITFLVNCVGTSICYRFEDTPRSEFERMLGTNFMGSVNITQVLVPLMKNRKKGNIIFVSSMAGLVGLYGYSAYCASKSALKGLAEALQMEVKPFNIRVTVSFPPDTDTPGFAEEIKQKLTETHLISESAGLYAASDVATRALDDALKGRFMSTLGFDAWIVKTACCGVTPASYLDLIIQVLTMGFCRIGVFQYLHQCDKIIKKCAESTKDDSGN